MNALDSEILGWINSGWGLNIFTETGVGFQRFYQDADAVTDITLEYWDLEKWNIPGALDYRYEDIVVVLGEETEIDEDGEEITVQITEVVRERMLDDDGNYVLYWEDINGNLMEPFGRVWRIDLNQNARWQNGTPIDAHTYIYSFQQLMDPVQMNHRGGGLAGSASSWPGSSAFINGYLTDWDEVGLYALDDYTLIWITSAPVDRWTFDWESGIMNGTLVYAELFESTQYWAAEDFLAHTYGTSVETTMSYGPFMLVSFEHDRQFTFERNPYFHGWHDPRFEGQWPMTHIVYDILPEPAIRLMLFEQGMLDLIGLTADDIDRFRFSDRLYHTPGTATFRFIFATNLESLIALEEERGDGNNVRMLYYQEFRRGISLSMDRATYVAETTAANLPFVFLFNDLYFYDIANNPDSIYRHSDITMQAAVELYNISWGGPDDVFQTLDEAYEAITGFDVVGARIAFQNAAEQALEDGNWTRGQEVVIRVNLNATPNLTPSNIRANELMNDFLANATIGTYFEGLVRMEFVVGLQQQFLDVAHGRIEGIQGAWQGEWARPFFMIGVYTNPDVFGGNIDAIHESNGFDPTVETLAISIETLGNLPRRALPFVQGDYVVLTYQQWHQTINSGGEVGGMFTTDPQQRLRVLAELEFGILSQFRAIPFAFSASASLLSYKIDWGIQEFNIVYGRGGFRFSTFNFNDQEWEEFVASHGGMLNYE
jgi:oligopeptide transport system substrate-binding protein